MVSVQYLIRITLEDAEGECAGYIGQGSMKGRYCKTLLLAAMAVLLASIPAYSKIAGSSPKTHAKQKKIKSGPPAKAQPDSDNTHVVRRGDTLYQIARTHQTTTAELKSANGLRSSSIKPGQTLVIPGTRTAASYKEPAKKKDRAPSPSEQAAVQYISQLREQNLNSGDESISTRLRLAEAGFKMIDIRYRFGGGSEKTGFDCSGLVKSLFSKFNINLPRSSREQFDQGEKIDRDSLQIGDLVFFSSGGSRPTHVGIYVGNDKFLHAARKARRVVVSDLNKFWYTMRYLGARRIAELWWDDTDSETETATE